jgi:hypothetical protein
MPVKLYSCHTLCKDIEVETVLQYLLHRLSYFRITPDVMAGASNSGGGGGFWIPAQPHQANGGTNFP